MEQSKELKRIVFIRNHKRLLVIAALFPTIICGVALIRQLVEYYFRFSKEYKYIYSIVSTIGLFIQMGALLASIVFALYVLLGLKVVNNPLVVALSVLLSLLPLAWIVISLTFL